MTRYINQIRFIKSFDQCNGSCPPHCKGQHEPEPIGKCELCLEDEQSTQVDTGIKFLGIRNVCDWCAIHWND